MMRRRRRNRNQQTNQTSSSSTSTSPSTTSSASTSSVTSPSSSGSSSPGSSEATTKPKTMAFSKQASTQKYFFTTTNLTENQQRNKSQKKNLQKPKPNFFFEKKLNQKQRQTKTTATTGKRTERVLFHSLSSKEAQALLAPFEGGLETLVSEGTCLNSLKLFVASLVELFLNTKDTNVKSLARDQTLANSQQWKGLNLRTYQDWLNAINQLIDESGIVEYPPSSATAIKNSKTVSFLSSLPSLSAFQTRSSPEKEETCFKEGLQTVVQQVGQHLCSIAFISRDKVNLEKFVKALSRHNRINDMTPEEMEQSVESLVRKKKDIFETWRTKLLDTEKEAKAAGQNSVLWFAQAIWNLYLALVEANENAEGKADYIVFGGLNYQGFEQGYKKERETKKKIYLDQLSKVCRQYNSPETCPTDTCKYGSYFLFWKRCTGLNKVPLLGEPAIKELIQTVEKKRPFI